MSGRAWARAALALGAAASIAANVAHALVAGQPAAAACAAALWPVLVLVAVETMARTRWPAGWSWAACRVGGLGIVAAVAAVVSYSHMSGLLRAWGEAPAVYLAGPVAVDGLMVMATAAILADGATVEAPAPVVLDEAPAVALDAAPAPAAVARVEAPVLDAATVSVELDDTPAPVVLDALVESAPVVLDDVPPAEARPRRSRDETYAALLRAVEVGDLPARPSQRQALAVLGGGAQSMRAALTRLRDEQEIPGLSLVK